MGAPRLTKEAKQAILASYRRGDRVAAIAARFGVHQSYPGLLAKRRGFAVRKSSGPEASA
jgi:transposase-like protein